jgi:hypothetical protein
MDNSIDKSKKNSTENLEEYETGNISPKQTLFEDFSKKCYISDNKRPNLIEKISNDEDKHLPVLSVIVTICGGNTYDGLFCEVEQKAPEGGRVSVYRLSLNKLSEMTAILKNEMAMAAIKEIEARETVIELLKDIEGLESDCILFNFECCSGFEVGNTFNFPDKQSALNFLELIIERGNTIMFSDFAVKGLINGWDEKILGSNPFRLEGQCSDFMKLYFDPEVLKNSTSVQLKIVGELSQNGEATIHALSSTVVFSCDVNKVDKDLYDLEILTIVTDTNEFLIQNCHNKTKLKEKSGTAGHVILKYKKSGCNIILSAGHWIELSNLNVDVKNLEKVADYMGGEYKRDMEEIKNDKSLKENERSERFKSIANKYVQQSTPCNYSQSRSQNKK